MSSFHKTLMHEFYVSNLKITIFLRIVSSRLRLHLWFLNSNLILQCAGGRHNTVMHGQGTIHIFLSDTRLGFALIRCCFLHWFHDAKCFLKKPTALVQLSEVSTPCWIRLFHTPEDNFFVSVDNYVFYNLPFRNGGITLPIAHRR